MYTSQQYKKFQEQFKSMAKEHPDYIVKTLSNILTMRIIGNKTHGDLAEIGITKFINEYMDGYSCEHVGKDRFRAKEHEEDIVITDETDNKKIPVSLKAYGDGPLQLSTDKGSCLFSELKKYGTKINDVEDIGNLFNSKVFTSLYSVNVMPLIYRENKKQCKCNIMVFDFDKMKQETAKILYVDTDHKYDKKKQEIIKKTGRKHPIYMFLNRSDDYICEVRYGGTTANALQRGFWTNTVKASDYFYSLTDGWISYKHNEKLVELIQSALVCTEDGHIEANTILQKSIDEFRRTR